MEETEFGNSKRMRIEDGTSENFLRKKACLGRVYSAENRGILSPITEISKNLSGATIGTPKWKNEKKIARKVNELSYMDDISFYDDGEQQQQSQISSFPQDDELLGEETTKNLKLFCHKLNSLDDFDCNSMDSGFNSNASLRRRSTGTSLFRANSVDSMDDEYLELMALEDELEAQHLPSNLNSLITSSIKTDNNPESPELKRPLCPKMSNTMRARSLFFEPKTPELLKKTKENDTNTPKSFKKPEMSKRSLTKGVCSADKENQASLRKCMSMNDADIMSALSRPTTEEHIGDHSKPYVLPLIKGRHHDLKSITCDTMAQLLQGEFDDKIASYKVIDCRYPYEFEGGHIRGAANWYNQEMILENLVSDTNVYPKGGTEHRTILVFHCEFSSERGPKMSRFLRNFDRNANEYPTLQFPEIYLLHNGYKEFFEHFSHLCDPVNYLPMLDPSHGDELRHFRSKSKTWNGEAKCASSTNRLKKSKSRLVL
ncbi:CDC25A.2 family protein [Megaselia abdita]